MNWFTILMTCVACINFLLLIFMVFLEKRQAAKHYCVADRFDFSAHHGFLLYVIFGSGLSVRTRRMIRKKAILSAT